MLREWERKFPGRIDNMFNAMGRVAPSHLMDRNLYPFTTLQATGVADRRATRPSTMTARIAPVRPWFA